MKSSIYTVALTEPHEKYAPPGMLLEIGLSGEIFIIEIKTYEEEKEKEYLRDLPPVDYGHMYKTLGTMELNAKEFLEVVNFLYQMEK